VDDVVKSMNLLVLKTPTRVSQANAFGERLIGTARRECLDYVIPLNAAPAEDPRRRVSHYNHGRLNGSLGRIVASVEGRAYDLTCPVASIALRGFQQE
jgi:putative transposase